MTRLALWAAYGAFAYSMLCMCYFGTMRAQAMREAGTLSPFWMRSLVLAVTAGYLLDVAFNLTYGTVRFRELPRELTFSKRVARHYRSPRQPWRHHIASRWADRLNAVSAGHV